MDQLTIISTYDRCLEEGAKEFFLKPVKISDVHKLKPHMMRTKVKETVIDQNEQKYNEERKEQNQEHEEHNVLETSEVELQQQSNGNKRKSMEEGTLTIQNKSQIQWWPYCRFD